MSGREPTDSGLSINGREWFRGSVAGNGSAQEAVSGSGRPPVPRSYRFFAALAQAPPSAAFRPSGFRGKRRSGGAFSSSSPHPLARRLAQVQPEPMDIEGDDREADRQLEPVRAAQPDLVQPAVLQQLYLSAVKILVESRRERIVEGPFSSAAGLQDLGGLFSCVPFFFSVSRSVRLFFVRGGAGSVESLWTILVRAAFGFRVRGPD